MEQLLFYPLMDVLHVRLYVNQGSTSTYVLQLPRRIVDERLEPLGVSEESVEAFALWGVSDTLHDGGAEVRFREEGITDQVLVFLWREERVFGNDVGVLCPYSLGSIWEVGGRVFSRVRWWVACTATTSTDCSGGHCIMLNMK